MKTIMNLLSLGILACPAIMAADETKTPESSKPREGVDMIRFANHDTLHGIFQSFGANDTLQWQSSESPDSIAFSTQKLHRVTLNRGLAHKAITYKSSTHLINGDVIPGTIISANQSSVVMETEMLGTITIPRDTITQLSPRPFGGKLLYYGPLNSDGWKTVGLEKDDEAEDDDDDPFGAENLDKDSKKKSTKKDEKERDWKYLANAWYAGSDKKSYLVRENALPDQCRISFKMAWRGSLYANIILHADFTPPEVKDDDDQKKKSGYSVSNTPGHAYILSISNHSATLSSLTYDANGKLQTNRFNDTRVSLGLSTADQAKIEIRLDRKNKSILLFSDGSFKGKWDLGENYDGKGNHLAFARSTHYNNAELRISDIAISHWNGMKDSAQSMTSAKRDIILLNNGVDRFSGTFQQIRDGQVTFKGTFDNTMTIPIEEIQEVHFATTTLKITPKTAKKAVYFFVYPYGRITGVPTATPSGEKGKTTLSTDLLGEIELDTRYMNIIDFSHKNSLLDTWDDNF